MQPNNEESASSTSFFWLGLWLLASSWLFGLDYFSKANPIVWVVLVTGGTILICFSQAGAVPYSGAPTVRGFQLPAVLTLVLLLPSIFITPWPYRLGPLLMVSGALLEMCVLLLRWLRATSGGLSLAGTMLLIQSVTLLAYKHFSARSHELPWPLPQALAGIVRVVGVNAAADGSELILPTMRLNHRLGATWEFLLEPATLCFVAGGFAALLLATCRSHGDEAQPGSAQAEAKNRGLHTVTPAKKRSSTKSCESKATQNQFALSPALKPIGLLLLSTALWLPLRAALQAGIFLHRALRTDYEAPLNLMNQLWSPWPQLLLLLPLALLVSWWMRNVHVSVFRCDLPGAWPRRLLLPAAGLGFASSAVLTLGILWDPVGAPKAGRVAVDEFHSRWEPTGRPMDTEWYGHLSGYNYACLYDFCSCYYDMSRFTNSLTDAGLANVDVLILKVPTEPFAPVEIDAILRYVERGGGVLMIGEHTDVFNTGFHLNSVARHFGFTFRYDCLFGMESFFDQFYPLQLVRHPVLQNVPAFDFATSCSIDASHASGRGVIVATALKNSMADYHANNYYPQAVDHAAMRSGAFVQLWSARHGHGRVLAFTDSTIFSNFSAFEPGKSELFLGMLEWLNRRDGIGNPRPFVLLVGVILLAWAAFVAFKQPAGRRLMVAASAFGWSATCLGLMMYQRHALPEPKPVRPLTWVTIDRTICEGPLSKGGFIAGKADGFGIFERWILRLGYFTKRRNGPDALQGDLLVFLYPTKPVAPEFRQSLIRYVEGGGKILVLDSPTNTSSTAAMLLEPFHLLPKPLPNQAGTLSGPSGWPTVPVDAVHEIVGGQALFHLNGKPVGSVARHGKGTVVALGFGSRFTDPQMGVTGDVEPDAQLRKVFDLQFTLVRAIIDDKLEAVTSAAK